MDQLDDKVIMIDVSLTRVARRDGKPKIDWSTHCRPHFAWKYLYRHKGRKVRGRPNYPVPNSIRKPWEVRFENTITQHGIGVKDFLERICNDLQPGH